MNVKIVFKLFLSVFTALFFLSVSAKEKPQPQGEMISLDYLNTHTFADALLNYKNWEDKLKVNSADRLALWNMGLSYFVIANNDKNYTNKCLEAWDNYLRSYPNDGFALWNRAFVKQYFQVGNFCSDVKAATLSVKKKYLPKEPESLYDCLKRK